MELLTVVYSMWCVVSGKTLDGLWKVVCSVWCVVCGETLDGMR